MSRYFFIALILVAGIIRLPLSILIVVIRPLVPFIRNRLNFERKNFIEESSWSFKKENKKADYCFEVSSEGELEQIRPLLEAVLLEKKLVEIIFSSPSVESKCLAIYRERPESVRIYRMPLLSASPFTLLYFQSVWEWVSAPVIVFCRYDFFPELLAFKLAGKKFVLVSGAFKKMSWYKRESFKFFDTVIAATDNEAQHFKALLGEKARVFSCDFRIPRISSRLKNAAATFDKKPFLKNYLEKLERTPQSEKIIFGSMWASDLSILRNDELLAKVRSGKMNLLLVPHKLDDAFVQTLSDACAVYFGKEHVQLVNEQSVYNNQASVVVLQTGGILCELYTLFSASYVGGGYERSIHSVLEPFFSNNVVVVGPKIHRSTEIDLAQEVVPGEIHVLNRPDSFYNVIESINFKEMDLSARERFRLKTAQEMQAILTGLLG